MQILSGTKAIKRGLGCLALACAANSAPALAEDETVAEAIEEAPVRPVITVSRAAHLVGNHIAPVLSGPEGLEGLMGAGQLPMSASLISSRFGMRRDPIAGNWRQHSGTDFAAAQGTPVPAAQDGVIKFAGRSGNYGNMVVIDHGEGVETRYAHLSQINVTVGANVTKGQQLGRVGNTGRSTGPHLHYEVRVEGRAINPL